MDPSSAHRKTLKVRYDGDNEELQKLFRLFKLLSNTFIQISHILRNAALTL